MFLKIGLSIASGVSRLRYLWSYNNEKHEYYVNEDGDRYVENTTYPDEVILLTNDQSVLATTTITLAGAISTIDWGDGKTEATSAGETIYTHDYDVTGSYPIRIYGGLSDLTKIEVVTQAFISGDIAWASYLTNLEQFRLYLTYVSGNISSISNLTSLTNLYISSTSISGDISNLSNLTSLTYINLSSTSISGDIGSLSSLASLIGLHANDNSLTYTSTTLPNWSSCIIDVRNNGWTQTEVDNFIIDVAGANLGSELLSGWDFTSGWTVFGSGVTISDSDTFISTSNNTGIRKNYTTIGTFYKLRIVGDVSPGTTYIGSGSTTTKSGLTGSFDETFYFEASSAELRILNESSATTNITSISLNEITSYTVPTSLTLTINGTNASRTAASDDAVIGIVDASGTVVANGGSFGAALTSGLLVATTDYKIILFVAGDDFVNVGATNVTGNEFTATGTTPTTWTNLSELREVIA